MALGAVDPKFHTPITGSPTISQTRTTPGSTAVDETNHGVYDDVNSSTNAGVCSPNDTGPTYNAVIHPQLITVNTAASLDSAVTQHNSKSNVSYSAI